MNDILFCCLPTIYENDFIFTTRQPAEQFRNIEKSYRPQKNFDAINMSQFTIFTIYATVVHKSSEKEHHMLYVTNKIQFGKNI